MGRVSFADDVTKHTMDEYDEEIEHEPVNIYPYENDKENKSWAGALPKKQGLYDPELREGCMRCRLRCPYQRCGKPQDRHRWYVTIQQIAGIDAKSWQHAICSAT